jgi:hypothetical protein
MQDGSCRIGGFWHGQAQGQEWRKNAPTGEVTGPQGLCAAQATPGSAGPIWGSLFFRE